jgi:hypothetical protein
MHQKQEELWDNTAIQKPVGVLQYEKGGSVFKIPSKILKTGVLKILV